MLRRKCVPLIVTALSTSMLLLSCSQPEDEIAGILKNGPSYDSSIPRKHRFGKLLLTGTNGHVYALREGKGFRVRDADGKSLSEPNGQYPIYVGAEYRLIGRTIEISDAIRELKTEDKPSELWYPPEATALFDVETMIVTKVSVAEPSADQ